MIKRKMLCPHFDAETRTRNCPRGITCKRALRFQQLSPERSGNDYCMGLGNEQIKKNRSY